MEHVLSQGVLMELHKFGTRILVSISTPIMGIKILIFSILLLKEFPGSIESLGHPMGSTLPHVTNLLLLVILQQYKCGMQKQGKCLLFIVVIPTVYIPLDGLL